MNRAPVTRQRSGWADVAFVMHEYVAVHPTTFHLHEHPERLP